MRNILTTLFIMLCGPLVVTAQNTVTIRGTVKGDLKGHTKVYIYGNEDKKDSVVIENGGFEFNVPFVKPFIPSLYTEYDVKVKGRKNLFEIAVDKPGTIYLKDVNIDTGLYSSKVSGLKSATEYSQFNVARVRLFKEIVDHLNITYGDNMTKKSPNYTNYVTDFKEAYGLRQGIVLHRYLKENPNAYISIHLLNNFKTFMEIGDLEKNYQLLSKNLRESETGKDLANYIAGAKTSQIGRVINDFSLNDVNDQPFSFSQFKGKYVLIDFWASWCHPCIAAFPHMKELYKKYKSDNVEFYSISIDQSKPAWLKELKKHDLPWMQARDTKNISLNTFAVTVVPTTILIDPEGKIIMKEAGAGPSGDGYLEKKLIELFGAK